MITATLIHITSLMGLVVNAFILIFPAVNAVCAHSTVEEVFPVVPFEVIISVAAVSYVVALSAPEVVVPGVSV